MRFPQITESRVVTALTGVALGLSYNLITVKEIIIGLVIGRFTYRINHLDPAEEETWQALSQLDTADTVFDAALFCAGVVMPTQAERAYLASLGKETLDYTMQTISGIVEEVNIRIRGPQRA